MIAVRALPVVFGYLGAIALGGLWFGWQAAFVIWLGIPTAMGIWLCITDAADRSRRPD